MAKLMTEEQKASVERMFLNLGEGATKKELNAYMKGYKQAHQDLLDQFAKIKRKEVE